MRRVSWVVVGLVLAGCNQHPVSYTDALADVEFQVPIDVAPEDNLDILWVIDNSGSMCQEQAVLRENFDSFVDQLDNAALNFHVGVTTTHMDEFPTEPVAVPGHLQSQPQPLVGFDDTCWTAVDEDGEAIPGDYEPIRQLIDVAVDCMETPDESYREITNAEIECALYDEPEDCEIAGRCAAGQCQREDIFPPLDAAREIPRVLRSEDYRVDDGTLDVGRLKDDFACMATVGMRGYGFEKGLGAAVTAVSPELTGGAVGLADADSTAPNYGLIRDDARFAVVFVTDENDCTHDGTLTERAGNCGDDTCDFWNHESADEETPLIAPEVLRDQMIENLRQTKGDPDFDPADILVASIHGNSVRYDGPVIPGPECLVSSPDELVPASCGAMSFCQDPGYEEVPTTCSTRLGTAYSGDRYDRFLRTFEPGNYFPAAEDEGTPVFGWMCTDTFQPALVAIGEFLRSANTGCITRPVRSCDPEGSCPAHPYSEEAGTCIQKPGGGEKWFCDSYVQVRVYPPDGEVAERLRTTGFCHADSFGETVNGGGCVVDPRHYQFDACDGLDTGLRVAWSDVDQAERLLAGTELELRFVSE